MKLEVCAFIIVQWGVKAVRLSFVHLQNLKLLFISLLLRLFLSFLVFPFSPPPLHLLSQTLLFSSLAMRQLVFYVLSLTCIRIFFVCNISVACLHLLCCAFDFLCLQRIFPWIHTWLSSSATCVAAFHVYCVQGKTHFLMFFIFWKAQFFFKCFSGLLLSSFCFPFFFNPFFLGSTMDLMSTCNCLDSCKCCWCWCCWCWYVFLVDASSCKEGWWHLPSN